MGFKPREVNVFNFEKTGDFVQGKLIQIKDEVGENKSKIYLLETKGNAIVSVWGTTVLDNKMSVMKLGETIKITYLGMKKSDKASKRDYRDFEVLVDDGKPELEST